jgi:hypothetical protein
MERSAGPGKAQEKTTGTVLVFRVVLDNLAVGESLAYFLDLDMARDDLIRCMFGELE